MVKITTTFVTLLASGLIGSTFAHPGEHHDHEHVKREIAMRDEHAAYSKRTLANCTNSVSSRALKERSIARRAERAQQLRAKRGITTDTMKHRRALTDLQAYELVDHNQTALGYTTETAASTLFSANTTYALTPEVVIGPYFVSGEYIRSDVSESQAGVPVHLEMQFVDINSCGAVSDLTIDIWAANATGVYSGIASQGGLNSTFLRGVQVTDSEGVVEFDTIFPGHYQGRATHTHVTSHVNGTILPNGTYTGGTANHIGQLFFDEALRSAVEATSPYSENTQAVTSNDADSWAPSAADGDYDPFPEYVMLGNSLSDGLLMFITIGVDSSADYDSVASVAAYLAADGGHSNTGTGTGAGSGGGSGSGSGASPSATTIYSFTAGGNVSLAPESRTMAGKALAGLIAAFAVALVMMAN